MQAEGLVDMLVEGLLGPAAPARGLCGRRDLLRVRGRLGGGLVDGVGGGRGSALGVGGVLTGRA